MVKITRKALAGSGRAGRRPAAQVEQWCRSFEEECRRRGIRVTAQRLAVYRALAGDVNHPAAEAVYARLHPEMPSMSLATVYRILECLEQEGLIRRVSTTDGFGRFDANTAPHQHLFCRRCGRMIDVEVESLSRIGIPRLKQAGFTPEEIDIRIVGTCRDCVAGQGAGRAQKCDQQ